MTDQPDGSYPRLNGSLLQTGRFSNQIVSLLGKVIMFDGTTIKLHCADGVIAIVKCEPDAEVQQGYIYELVGHANEDNTLQLFVSRQLSIDMNLDLYNRMLTEVLHNPKFSDYFSPIRAK